MAQCTPSSASDVADVETPLLANHHAASVGGSAPVLYTNWLGLPIADGRALGGWKCCACLICAYGFETLAATGILVNMVVFLVREWGWSNAAAASCVSNLWGTIFLSAFLTASVTDAYIGRLWTSLISQILFLLCLVFGSCIVWLLTSGIFTARMKTTFMVTLYMLSIVMGPIVPSIPILAADQLMSMDQKEICFKLLSISTTLGQLLATMVVTYVDEAGMWVVGFWICTVMAGISTSLTWIVAPQCRAYKSLENPLVQIAQVFAAAWRRRSLSFPNETSLLDKCNGTHSSIPCSDRIPHTRCLSFLDKAAMLSPKEPTSDERNPWCISTLEEVEDLKCLLRIIPFGISFMLLTATSGQVSTLFEEQALVMDRQVTSWLIIPPASLNLFFIAGSLTFGIFNTLGGVQGNGLLVGCCQHRRPTPLQLQGVGLVLCILAMVMAALVESQRLSRNQDGATFSILWLIPQTFLIGASVHINLATSGEFFYKEASEGMRMLSNCILSLFNGLGNYLVSLLVIIVTAITTRGGQEGWIASDLNEGHLDYFYWLFAILLAITLCFHLAYGNFYTCTKKSHTIFRNSPWNDA